MGQITTITAVGDLMFHGQLALIPDPLWGFRLLGDNLLKGDVLFGNFETPISEMRQNEADAPSLFFTQPGRGRALKEYGFSVVNLANNHIYDFGPEGVECTTTELNECGLSYVGIGANAELATIPAIIETPSGSKVGFLGYTTANNALDKKHQYVACFPEINLLKSQIKKLLPKVDIVVVSCHTGAQYNPYPAPETRELAHAVIEAGASVYLGHHPHVSQGIEKIGNGLAVYSLGDFVAPPSDMPARRKTFFVRIKLDGPVVNDFEVIPCFVNDDGQTEIARGETAAQIESNIGDLSRTIETGQSDDLHFAWAKDRIVSQYINSWIEEIKVGGYKIILRKIKTLRPYHFQLIRKAILAKILK